MKFNEYIKNAREKCKLTQEMAAEKIGVSITTIQNWEKGQLPSGKENLLKIINAYSLKRNQFFRFYNEAILPTASDAEKHEFPYFFFSEGENLLLPSFKITEEEKELLSLLYLYNPDFEEIFEVGDIEDIKIALSNLPYDYVKENGAFYVINMCASMISKYKEYLPYIIKYSIVNPDKCFDISTMTANEIYTTFECDLVNTINLLISIDGTKDKKETLYTFDKDFGLINIYDAYVYQNSTVCAQIFNEKIAPLFGNFVETIDINPDEMFKNANIVEGKIIKSKMKCKTIEAQFEALYFMDWNENYFDLSKDENGIYISMTETGKTLLEWYKNEGKDILNLYDNPISMFKYCSSQFRSSMLSMGISELHRMSE